MMNINYIKVEMGDGMGVIVCENYEIVIKILQNDWKYQIIYNEN